MLLCVSILHAYLLLNGITLNGYTTLYFPFTCSWIFSLFSDTSAIRIMSCYAFTKFSKVLVTFYISTVRIPIEQQPLQHSVCHIFIIIGIVQSYLIAILICISLVTNDAEHLSYFPSIYLICYLYIFFDDGSNILSLVLFSHVCSY